VLVDELPEPAAMEEEDMLLDRDRARRALAGLSPAERQLLSQAYFYGWTAREIAETEGTPLGTVKTRLRAALIKLRKAEAEVLGAVDASVAPPEGLAPGGARPRGSLARGRARGCGRGGMGGRRAPARSRHQARRRPAAPRHQRSRSDHRQLRRPAIPGPVVAGGGHGELGHGCDRERPGGRQLRPRRCPPDRAQREPLFGSADRSLGERHDARAPGAEHERRPGPAPIPDPGPH